MTAKALPGLPGRRALLFIASLGGILCFLPLFIQSKSFLESSTTRQFISNDWWRGASLVSLTLASLIAVDYIVENIHKMFIFIFLGPHRRDSAKSDRTNKIQDSDRDFMDDSERLVFILGMIIASITALIASSSSLPTAVQDQAGLIYLCGRMSQICLVGSAIAISLHRMSGSLFPRWALTLVVIACIVGSVAGSFLINRQYQYSNAQMGSSPLSSQFSSPSPSLAVVHAVLIIFVAGATLVSCCR
jgi:hypothetical protein